MIDHYRNIFASRTEQELEALANIKRFMERFSADEVFRNKLQENHLNPNSVAAEYGLEIDLQLALPLWHKQYSKSRFQTELTQEWPLAAMFDSYVNDMRKLRSIMREQGGMSNYPRFHSWRERQIARSTSEMPGSYETIPHSIIAFELSQGCSVGCWFCGISADKFAGYYPYNPENAQLWRTIVQVVHELFGAAAHTGFFYWATDPCDNPDYVEFISDYHQITGYLPQTTTAAPLRNLELTRNILHLSDQYCCVNNRFSIISLRLLNQVHQTFTARELLTVELIAQNKESIRLKTLAGRASEHRKSFRHSGRNDEILKLKSDHSTIACVSGFLVNMMKQTVQLISPTRASEKWPLGYRIYDERHFTNSRTFRTALVEMIDEFMPESVLEGNLISFREDLTFEAAPDDDGSRFQLRSKWVKHTCKGFAFMRFFGELIDSGSYSADMLTAQLVEAGADMEQTKNALQHLYDKGLLNDEPDAYANTKRLA